MPETVKIVEIFRYFVVALLIGLPGTIYFFRLRLRFDWEFFKNQPQTMLIVVPSLLAVAIGFLGCVVLGSAFLLLRIFGAD